MSVTIADNLNHIRDRIAAAVVRSGRDPAAVKLVAVTKYASTESIAALIEAGCRDLGESRPQQLWGRAPEFVGSGVRWHLIGHLQRNKVARTLSLVSLVHSCDSLRIAEAIDLAAVQQRLPPIEALLEVNISGDLAKGGFATEEVEPALVQLAALSHLRIRGLMAMAGKPDDETAARSDFCRLRELAERMRANLPAEMALDELSMGMSGDYEVAIEEGATIVRVGSALFEGVDE